MKPTIKSISLAAAGLAFSLSACTESPTSEIKTQPVAVTETLSIAPPRCDDGAPHPDAPKELAEFAFLIGDYTIAAHAWRNGAWTPPRPGPQARWNGWYGLGGMTIHDEWYGTDPGLKPDTGRGINVRFYDTKSSEWKMMWIHTKAATVQDLRAEMKDGKLTMWQVYPERPNFRAEFNVIDKGHWNRITFAKDDDGNWVKTIKLAATRIACD